MILFDHPFQDNLRGLRECSGLSLLLLIIITTTSRLLNFLVLIVLVITTTTTTTGLLLLLLRPLMSMKYFPFLVCLVSGHVTSRSWQSRKAAALARNGHDLVSYCYVFTMSFRFLGDFWWFLCSCYEKLDGIF